VIAGVDGYRKRWLVAIMDHAGRTALQLVDDFATLAGRADLHLIVIDVPIGLLEIGRRHCDTLARQRIGPRRNSVFTAPLRPMLLASSHAEASAIRRRIEEKGYSVQGFGILPLVRSVDQVMTPALQTRIREGHPEVSFAAMAGRPLQHPKLKPAGKLERIELLRTEFADLDDQIARFNRRGALVDILDAYAMLWTARRVRDGLATAIPSTAQVDCRGLKAELVI
jgi:predicted RNase H-like nuclease